MRGFRRCAHAALILVVSVGVAEAQDNPPATSAPAPAATAATPPPAAPSAATAPSAAAPAAPVHEPPPSPAQTGTPAVVVDLQAMDGLIGKSVKGPTGEDMGRLIDLLVGTNGEIRAAIIDFGGVLGVGSRKVAVDWHALNFADSAKGGAIKVALTRDALRVAPEYRSGEPIVILQSQKPSAGAGEKAPAPRP